MKTNSTTNSVRAKLEQELCDQITLGKRLLALGIVLVFVGVYFFFQTQKDCASASRVPGKIVEMEKEQRQKDFEFYPVFSFVDSSGIPHVIHTRTSQARTWSGWNKFYRVGETVEVLYPRSEPDSARLNNPFAVWGTPLGFTGIGLILAVVGAFLWYGALHCPVAELAAHPEQLEEPK